jgi:hypothetical protein
MQPNPLDNSFNYEDSTTYTHIYNTILLCSKSLNMMSTKTTILLEKHNLEYV